MDRTKKHFVIVIFPKRSVNVKRHLRTPWLPSILRFIVPKAHMRIATAIRRRYERRPTDGSEVERILRIFIWNGYKSRGNEGFGRTGSSAKTRSRYG